MAFSAITTWKEYDTNYKTNVSIITFCSGDVSGKITTISDMYKVQVLAGFARVSSDHTVENDKFSYVSKIIGNNITIEQHKFKVTVSFVDAKTGTLYSTVISATMATPTTFRQMLSAYLSSKYNIDITDEVNHDFFLKNAIIEIEEDI